MKVTKPITHILCKLKTRFVLLLVVLVLAFAGPAVSLRDSSEANSGAPAANPVQTGCPPSRGQIGEFGPVIHLPLVPVHLSVLPNEKILFWGRDKTLSTTGAVRDAVGKSEAYVWNIPDGSNKTDVAVFRPSEGNWFVIKSSTNQSSITPWGVNGDIPVPADYDGDGKADLAVFRPSESNWYIIKSLTNQSSITQWGANGDTPVPGDYDGDGKADLAVFRPSVNQWLIIQSSNGQSLNRVWRENGDIPVPKDYDGDGKTDIAVYRPSNSTWHRINSVNGVVPFEWTVGISGDIPVPGDYFGDGHADLATYRPSNGLWTIRNLPKNTDSTHTFGIPSDRPAPGDYDGDGKTDLAIFRPSEGNWYIRNSSNGQIIVKQWGLSGDTLVPADYDGMRRVNNTTTNLFCSGHSFLPDGRLFVTGGHAHANFDAVGEKKTNIFNYTTNTWSPGPTMTTGRWYPFNVTLNTGETLIVSGSHWSNEPNEPVQTALTMTPEIANAQATSLTSHKTSTSLSLYPHMYLAPNGKVLQVGADYVKGQGLSAVETGSWFFDRDANNGVGLWEPQGSGSTIFPHASGSSVLFDSGRKVLLAGGFMPNGIPTNSAEFINLKPTTGQPTWTIAQSMNSVRGYHVATILPDGKILVTGGVTCQGGNNVDCPTGAAMNPEMWDPASNPANPGQVPWTTMAPQQEARAYHSIAALLPDGRVLVGGGGLPGAVGENDLFGAYITSTLDSDAKRSGHKNVEIYSPPYLFESNGCPAVRPSITSAPSSITYGQKFFIGTSGAGSNPKVSLVRLPSVTHAFNQDQRHTFLTASLSGSSGLNVDAPADSNKVPAGYYMLFVMNGDRVGKMVPSVAKIIRVQNTSVFEWLVETVNCTQITGWVWDRSKPNQAINVSIFDGPTLLATIPANQFRQDLLNADKGNGKHGFVFTLPASVKDGKVHSLTLRIAGTSTQLTPTPIKVACGARLFPNDVPVTTGSGAGQTWEQGVEFSSSLPGRITHIRFWKASGETGSHVGRIWTTSGVLLASVPFTNETPSGWQVAALTTPLQISAGTRYKVTYNINNVVAKTFDVFAGGPIVREPFTIWGSSFSTPGGSFPTTGSTSNLFADIWFSSPQ